MYKKGDVIRSLFCAVIFMIFFNSCTVTKVYPIYFDVLLPPTEGLEVPQQKIGVVVRNLKCPNDTLSQYYRIDKKVYKDTTNYDLLIAQSIHEGFNRRAKDYLADSILLLSLTPKHIFADSSVPIEPFSTNYVNSLCSTYDLDGFISLEHLSFSQQVVIRDYYTYWEASSAVVCKGIWRPYLPTSPYIDQDTASLIDTSYYTMNSEDYLGIIRGFPARGELLADAARQLGEKYAQRSFPYWLTQERLLLHNGSKLFLEGIRFVKLDDWRSALKQFQIVASSKKNHTSSLGLYDVSVCYERLGQFEQALSAIDLAIEKVDENDLINFFVDYKKTLIKRQEDYEVLLNKG